MSLDDVLRRISDSARALGLSELEAKRAERSLTKVLDRLERREYERFAFDGNVFDLPDRVKELITELEFYCSVGKTWARVLEAFGVAALPRVVDLCPGYAPKIELGLFYLGYTGEVLLLDADDRAFSDLQKFLALFAPRFAVRTERKDVWREAIGAHALVCANHVLDDLAVDHFAQAWGFQRSELYEKEGRLVEVWERILARREEHLGELTLRVAGVLAPAVAPNGLLIVAQYTSYIERVLDLREVTRFNVELLDRVRIALAARGFLDHTDAAARALDGPDLRFGAGEVIALEKPEDEQ